MCYQHDFLIMTNQNEIVIYKRRDDKIVVEVNIHNETIWLTQAQISSLFGTERSVITKHIRNIFYAGELSEKSNVQKMHIPSSDKPVTFYNLDVVLSVGYRVNSKRATQFRIWATSMLHDYIVKGYTLNQKRLRELKAKQLDEFEQAVGLIKKTIETRHLSSCEESGLLRVITDYANTWLLLHKYDKEQLAQPLKIKKATFILEYPFVREVILKLKGDLLQKKFASELFGQERERGLERIIASVNQSFDKKQLYQSVEEKAAHLLYFVIKDHPFVDGNKRIGSFLFILFLARSKYLYRFNGEKKINDNAMVALALLIAESAPQEKGTMIKLIMHFLVG